MRVLYNTCVADPFVFVAKKMQEDYGYEPVYWIGYDDDGSEELVKKYLPNTKYHPWRDAWKAIFPPEVEMKTKSVNQDIDMLKVNAVYELQAIKMMDRLDADRYSFNFMEREQFYLDLLKGWIACLDIYKPDVVISGVNPHRVYDYVLYVVCQNNGIPYLDFQYTLCTERTFCTDGHYTIGNIFENSYNDFLKDDNLSVNDLAPEIKKQYEKVTKSYKEAAPSYMAAHDKNNKKYSNLFYLLVKGITTYTIIGENSIKTKGNFSLKKKGVPMRYSRFSLYDTAKIKMDGLRYKKKLNKLYSSLTEMPAEEKYILLPLHYQPEATTSPAGDIFVNQMLAVETLLKNTPEDYMIYVKEHPQQFQSHMVGEKSRIEEYYRYLSNLPRVKMMPLEINSYELMKNAVAVATVTGTVGWEAVMHRKPVIIFGIIWYEKMPGVLRVSDSASSAKIKDFIDNYHFEEHKVLAYLKAVEENTVYAYHYIDEKSEMNMECSDCTNNLSVYLNKRINSCLNPQIHK